MSKIIAGEPSAWELRVRRPDTEWRRYSIYETHKQAKATMKRVEGPPLELKIVPLYSVEENHEQRTPELPAPQDG